MTPFRPVENLFGAVWKSSVTETIARHQGPPTRGGGIEIDHPMIAASNRYIDSLEKGQPIQATAGTGERLDSEPDVAPYLMQLHHQLAHVGFDDETALQAQLS